MKDKIREHLNTLKEDNTYGQEGIRKKVHELTQRKESLVKQKNQLTKEIKKLNVLIKQWEDEISPNQTSMF